MKHQNIYKVKVAILLFVTCLFTEVAAQDKIYRMGDIVPDLQFVHIYGTQDFPFKSLSSLKGKLIILDFWNTHCGPCVASLPKMDSLQLRFKDHIQIIPVTEDKKSDVEALMKKRFPNITLPFVTDDVKFRKAFSYGTVPHEVWIDGQGNLIAVTDHLEVSAKNIEKVLNNGPINFKMKKEFNFLLESDNPFLIADRSMGYKSLMYQSCLTKSSKDFRGGLGRDFLNEEKRLFRIWRSDGNIIELFLMAYNRSVLTPIVLENVKDSTRYVNHHQKDQTTTEWKKWNLDNSYNYDLIFPVKNPADNFSEILKKGLSIMQRELNTSFGDLYGLEARLEKRKVRCFVVTEGVSTKYKALTNGKPEKYRVGLNQIVWKNKPLQSFIDDITSYGTDHFAGDYLPVFNGTGYDGNVDIELSRLDCKNVDKLRAALKPYGLELKEEFRDLEVLVLKETVGKDI